MPWVILRTMSGERFLCQTEANLVDAITNRKPVQVSRVYSIVTLTLMGRMGPQRITALEYPDLQPGKPLESMHVLPVAWYRVSEEMAQGEIDRLDNAMEESKKAQVEVEAALRAQESGLVQARLTPKVPVPGGPGGVSGLGFPRGL